MRWWHPQAGLRVGVGLMLALGLLASGIGRGATGVTPPSPRTHAATTRAVPKAAGPKRAGRPASALIAARRGSGITASAPGRASTPLRPGAATRPQSKAVTPATAKIGSGLSGSADHRAGGASSLGGPAAYDAKRGAVIGGTMMRPKPRR